LSMEKVDNRPLWKYSFFIPKNELLLIDLASIMS